MTTASTHRKGKSLETALMALLESKDADVRAAAAIVIGELGIDDDAAMTGLRRRLGDGAPRVRLKVAQALGQLASETLAMDLGPLLTDSDPRVRDGVRDVLAGAKFLGPTDLEAMLKAKDEKERLGAVAVLGARGDEDSIQILGRTLPAAQGKFLDAVKVALMDNLTDAKEGLATAFIETLRGHLPVEKIDERSAVGVVASEVLGFVAGDGAVRLLLTWVSRSATESIRVAAAHALRRQASSRRLTHRLYEGVLEVIESEDTPESVLTPLSEALTMADLPMAAEPRVRKLTHAPNRSVRGFAIRALGGLDAAPAAKALTEVARGEDMIDRREAIAAASQTPSGRTALARLLGDTQEVSLAEAVAQVIRGSDGLLPSTIQQLEQAALDAPPDVSRVILALLKQVGGESAGRVQGSLFEKAMKLKNRGDLEEATRMFERMLDGSDDPEARFQLGVVQLRQSKKHITRGAKADPVAQTFRQLSRRRDFPTVERLSAESDLGPEDLFYLGFVLAEGDGDGQNLGGDILTQLSEQDEDAAVKRRAHNKLVTMGWIES